MTNLHPTNRTNNPEPARVIDLREARIRRDRRQRIARAERIELRRLGEPAETAPEVRRG